MGDSGTRDADHDDLGHPQSIPQLAAEDRAESQNGADHAQLVFFVTSGTDYVVTSVPPGAVVYAVPTYSTVVFDHGHVAQALTPGRGLGRVRVEGRRGRRGLGRDHVAGFCVVPLRK